MIIRHNSLAARVKFEKAVREIVTSTDPRKVQYLKICSIENLPKYSYRKNTFDTFQMYVEDEIHGIISFSASSICVCLNPYCKENHKTNNICAI